MGRRAISLGLALALAAMAPQAFAQGASAPPADSATGPAGPPNAVAHGPMPTVNSTLGDLADDPRSRPLLDQVFPGLTALPMFQMGRDMTLKDVQGMRPESISDAQIAELAKLLAAAAPH